MKKKIAKKAPKKKVSEPDSKPLKQKPLDEDWVDKIPDDLADAKDDYVSKLRLHNKAKTKLAAAKESTIELMVQHGIKRLPIDEGGKVLVLEDAHKLKTEKAKKAEDVAE